MDRGDGVAGSFATPGGAAIFAAMNPKQRAAEAALPFLRNGMTIGLGTGSTADFFLVALGEALASGRLKNIVGVATSRQSEFRAIELGIPLTNLAKVKRLDLTVDGADEIDPNLDLIKGLGGALVREKIVAQNSGQLIIIADASKMVPTLGAKVALPVEVVPFAHETHEAFFKSLGGVPTLRRAGGMFFNTDNGNLIYDCKFESIPDALFLQNHLRARAGIVGTGLFLGMANTTLVADEKGVTQRDRAMKKDAV
jgi:ribose 5-phosphate isomerase A